MDHPDTLQVDPSISSIGRLIEARADSIPGREAISAPGRLSMTYAGLQRQVAETVLRLNEFGVGRGDRCAIVLGNGPEMATAFLGTAAAATAAPLNPNYTAAEFEFYLSDLGARAVILQAGIDSPVRAVAASRGIAILEISPRRDVEAGSFEFLDAARSAPTASGLADSDDVALILHTSGTTSRPKMIPLSHSNLCASTANIGASLSLTPDDRCLNVMPLFHIHGLVAALLSSLGAGGSVVCSPGFSAANFFQWLDEHGPTWYTAVPAMHQELAVRAKDNREIIARRQLRFVRSSSSALAPRVMADLETVFGAPVIEAYGMTEAAHQMASNPLPPAARKPGSVGLPAGPEITILDEAGRPMPQGETGEIAIRGANVSSFGRSAQANSADGGWFRTGDMGFFDSDGYLFISGRLKEIINRGGEKISPRELDEVMLEHPGVAQAVACAVPDERLGEDVIMVVVRRPGVTLLERELREFASTRLADFKVPRRVVFVDQIPKGATGKIQRIGLAGKLGINSLSFARPADDAAFVAPQTREETVIAQIWKDLLKLDKVGATDNFFELGGDSLATAEVASRIRAQLGATIDVRQLAFGTLQQVAAACQQGAAGNVSPGHGNEGTPGAGSQDGHETLPLWRRLRRRLRRPLMVATLPVAKHLPIASYPGWFGRLHGFLVPNNARPRVWQGPGGGTNSRIILRLLDSVLRVDGDVAECGVWKAATLMPVGLYLKQHGSTKTAYGFDSFEGLGENVQVDIGLGGGFDDRKKVGGFSDTSYEELVEKVARYGLADTVKLVKGFFQDTLEDYADRRFCFVHMDCVIYESYKQCLEFFYPRLEKGAIVLLDEYRDPPWPGCTKAVDEFLAGKSEVIEEIVSDNQIKFYFRKT